MAVEKRENGKRKTKQEAENMIVYTEQVKLTGHELINKLITRMKLSR